MALGGILGYFSAKKERKDQKKAAADAQQFSERMSDTAYQRGMEDMRLAGLNPILAYRQGGASSPQGVLSQTTDIGAGLKDYEVGLTRAHTGRKVGKTTRTLATASAGKMVTAQGVDRAVTAKTMAETGHVMAQTRGTTADAVLKEHAAIKASRESAFYGTSRGKFNYELNKWMDPIGKAAGLAGAAIFGRQIGKGRHRSNRPPRNNALNINRAIRRRRH